MPATALVAAPAAMLTMRAAGRCSSQGRAAWVIVTAVATLTRYMSAQAWGPPSSSVLKAKPPATLTRTSRPPRRSTTAAAARPAAPASARSTPPRSCGAASAGPGARSTLATWAPRGSGRGRHGAAPVRRNRRSPAPPSPGGRSRRPRGRSQLQLSHDLLGRFRGGGVHGVDAEARGVGAARRGCPPR